MVLRSPVRILDVELSWVFGQTLAEKVSSSLPWFMNFDLWKTISAWVGVFAALLAGALYIHRNAVSPWIAKPVARAIHNELQDHIELIIFSEPMKSQLREMIQEEIVVGNRPVMDLLKKHDRRLDRLEKGQQEVLEATIRGDKK